MADLHAYRCVPFWTGEEWWCPHPNVMDTDLLAQNHYSTSMEKMLDYLGAED